MKKLAQWERKKRQQAAAFAEQVNGAEDCVFLGHGALVQMDPDRVSPLSAGDPHWREKLDPAGKSYLKLAEAMKAFLRADEKGDQEARDKAMEPFGRFFHGRKMAVYVATDGHGHYWRSPRPLEPAGDLAYPHAFVDDFFEYLEHWSDFLNLGVCHQCGKAYLKPKHGAKMRYCSRACGQKAYRERERRANA